MAKEGVKVDILATEPMLLAADIFYYNMFNACSTHFPSIKEYCELHSFCTEEILDSLYILQDISSRIT